MELATASTNLVLAYMHFSQKHETAIKYFPNNEKIQKLKEDAMGICDEHKMSSKTLTEDNTLSFSQDEEYWQDPAVIEAWDRFSEISSNKKHAESSINAMVVHPNESEPIDVTKIASESVQIASCIPDVGCSDRAAKNVFKKLGDSSFKSASGRSLAKGSGTPTFSLGVFSQETDSPPSNAPTEPVVASVSAQVGASVADASQAVGDALIANPQDLISDAQEALIVHKRKGDTEKKSSIPKKRKPQPSVLLRSPFKSRIMIIYNPLSPVQMSVLRAMFADDKNRL